MSHSHGPANYNRSFAIGIVLNIVFVAIEAIYGVLADSLALLADAGHNLSDVVGLLLAWGATVLAKKSRTERRTYGFRKATVIASLMSAVLLLVALGSIFWEAIGRLTHPSEVTGLTVVIVAAIGFVINTATALLFIQGQKEDINIRGAFLHMAADAAVSLGVVVAGIIIVATGWLWVDPITSIVISIIILIGTWGLFKTSLNYALDAVPENIDIVGIREYLMAIDVVERIHDLHVWPLSTTETALSVHLVVRNKLLDNNLLSKIQKQLHDEYRIKHSTIQIESSLDKIDCMLEEHNC